MKKNAFAEMFYQQCAGTTSGHMANIANNPVLFSMIGAATGSIDNCHACSRKEFADLLREIANDIATPE